MIQRGGAIHGWSVGDREREREMAKEIANHCVLHSSAMKYDFALLKKKKKSMYGNQHRQLMALLPLADKKNSK